MVRGGDASWCRRTIEPITLRNASVRPATDNSQNVRHNMSVGKLQQHLGPVARDLLINKLVNGRAIPSNLRTGLLRRLTRHDIASTARIKPGLFLGSLSGLTVGDHAFVNYDCFIDLAGPVSIGPNACLGYQVMLVTGSHNLGKSTRRAEGFIAAPITIGEGAWIGARVTVLPGVTIGAGSIVAAGSVVTHDCLPNTMYAGAPATEKRSLEDNDGQSQA